MLSDPMQSDPIEHYIQNHLVIIYPAKVGAKTFEFDFLNPTLPHELISNGEYYIDSHETDRQYILWNPDFSNSIECQRDTICITAQKLLGIVQKTMKAVKLISDADLVEFQRQFASSPMDLARKVITGVKPLDAYFEFN